MPTPGGQMRDVGVIGAGLAGAAVAVRLADIGRSITVIEARPLVCGHLSHAGVGAKRLDASAVWAAQGHLQFATSDIAACDSGWFEGAANAILATDPP